MSAAFVRCPDCGRLMLGQVTAGGTYPQPHDCPATPATEGDADA